MGTCCLVVGMCYVVQAVSPLVDDEPFMMHPRCWARVQPESSSWIAFESRTNALWIVQPSTGEGRQLTSDMDRLSLAGAEPDWTPWAPDGRTLAFAAELEGEIGVFTLRLDALRPTKLVGDLGGWPGQISWSPGGDKLAFQVGDWDAERCFVVDVQTGQLTELCRDLEACYSPVWLRDGRSLVWIGVEDGYHDVYVYDTHSGESSAITRHYSSSRIWSLSPSPDGSQIAVDDSPHLPQSFVTLIQMSNGALRGIETGIAIDLYPHWSPSGDYIALWSGGNNQDYAAMVDPESGSAKAIAGPFLIRGATRWAPDGDKLAVSVYAETELPATYGEKDSGIYVYDVRRDCLYNLTAKQTVPWSMDVSWGPKGMQLAYQGVDGSICVVNYDGTGLQVVGWGSSPAWAPVANMDVRIADSPAPSAASAP